MKNKEIVTNIHSPMRFKNLKPAVRFHNAKILLITLISASISIVISHEQCETQKYQLSKGDLSPSDLLAFLKRTIFQEDNDHGMDSIDRFNYEKDEKGLHQHDSVARKKHSIMRKTKQQVERLMLIRHKQHTRKHYFMHCYAITLHL